MTTLTGKLNNPRNPRYKVAGVALMLVGALILWLVYMQFRGNFTPKTRLTMLSPRAGLVLDAGAKVTYNGVQIGRVAKISAVEYRGKQAAKLSLDVYPTYIKLIPANVDAQIKATTVFGGKYVSFTTPKTPSAQRITPKNVIDATAVTTEINTLFETLTSLAEKVDPVKVNMTLAAAAEAFNGLGDKFGQALLNANAILDDVNPRMPNVRHDIQRLADLADTYTKSSPDLFHFLDNAVTTARTLRSQERDLDQALLAATGFGNSGADVVSRGGPYLAGGAADLVSTAQLLDTYSPELFCTLRNMADSAPIIYKAVGGGNGYSIQAVTEVLGGQNPYIYPENLPRVNARGGPGGAPGCWQPITRNFWPAPYLVMDTGVSLAPYNHFDIGSPYAIDYVWGRQVGDNTINP
jgi:phospholipid/cholesterol/gamma-HCH transport system substrate-binding protein